MTWPTGGVNGWEVFGTSLAGDVANVTLPAPIRALYYDPTPLGGSGRVLEQGVHTFGGSTVVARGRATSLEVEFLQPNIFGVHLMDWLVFDPAEPCAVVADLYDDDRTTIRWSVGTSPIHPNPYLEEPENYATQEVDFAAGAASLGTLSLMIVDRFRIPGDQDSGWFTDLLANAGIADIRGRRCRVRRFISEEIGWVVLADGPAGPPRLDGSYAAFTFEVRDTRETERKIQIFKGGGGIAPTAPGDPFDPTGVKTLLPDGVWGGYGYDADTNTYLIDPVEQVEGRAEIGLIPGVTSNPNMVSVNLQSTPGNPNSEIDITEAAYEAGYGDITYLNEWYEYGGILRRDYRISFPYLTLLWREQGSSDPWTELTGTLWIDGFQEDDGFTTTSIQDNIFLGTGGAAAGYQRVGSVIFGDSRGAPFCPADNQDIELVVIYRGPPTEDLPVYVEGITAGQLARNVYAGLYSARDAEGNLVPTGIRYNEADLLQMTDPVRLRFFAVVDDARDWLEKFIYAPTGWAPALNDQGEISPVSQVAPFSAFGLLEIGNAITEPSPDWDAGQRIVNVVKFTYPRDFRPTLIADAETGDGLSDRDIVVEFIDPISVDRNGRHAIEIDGSAFRAIGNSDGDPVGGDRTAELGHVLATLRQMHIGNRYAFGAPAISVAVMRAATTGLRAGSWVVVDLSWVPDYATGKRGLLAMGQVIALGDLDCAWRQTLIEVVTPLAEPGS
jgi:hypothetical protein